MSTNTSTDDQNQDSEGDQHIEDVPAYKRKRVVIPILIATAAIVGGAYFWAVNAMRYVSTDDAQVDGDRITISSKFLGRVAELRVQDADTIRAGDTLVLLDGKDVALQERKAQAMITVQTRSADIAATQTARTRDDFERAKVQFAKGLVSREQYDHALRAFEQAQAQQQLSQSQIASAQADLTIIRNQLANTAVLATDSGIVAKHWVQPGDVVSPGQAIYTVFAAWKPWVSAYFEETKLRRIRVGAPVQISVDAYPDARYEGVVEWIGSSTAAQFSIIPPSNASGNFTKITQRVPVRIALRPAPGQRPLLLGLSVSVKIQAR
ncbi:MAG TPA: HlyD family secretion protein [Fibrobacteria bacterium]|nr:HlyD family secretion protein [Fibrobacteria bacterium]